MSNINHFPTKLRRRRLGIAALATTGFVGLTAGFAPASGAEITRGEASSDATCDVIDFAVEGEAIAVEELDPTVVEGIVEMIEIGELDGEITHFVDGTAITWADAVGDDVPDGTVSEGIAQELTPIDIAELNDIVETIEAGELAGEITQFVDDTAIAWTDVANTACDTSLATAMSAGPSRQS